MKSLYNFKLDRKQLHEAKSTLTHTLLLPDILPVESNNQDRWINDAIWNCHCNCHPSIFMEKNYSFFCPMGNCSDPNSIINVAFTNKGVDKDSEDELDFMKRDFFGNTIIMQCIMFAYDIVMQSLISNDVTAYSFCNKIKNLGHNELRDKNILDGDFNWCNYNVGDSNASNSNDSNSNDSNSGASSLASSFSSKLKCRKDMLINCGFDKSFYMDDKFQYTESALLYNILSYDKDFNYFDFVKLLNLYHTNYSKGNDFDIADNVIAKFYDFTYEKLKNMENPTDRLYYLYRFENIFGLNLAGHLNILINQQEKQHKNFLLEPSIMNKLALISKLPNVFSRDLYIQFAFDAIKAGTSPGCFFDAIKKPEEVMSRSDAEEFTMLQWIEDYKRFCTFMGEFVFPVHEWYFLLTLFETVEKHEKKLKFRERLIKLQQLLRNYIDENYEKIENPFWGEKNKGLSLLANYNSDKIIKLDSKVNFGEDLPTILSAFKSACKDTVLPEKELRKDFCFSSINSFSVMRFRSQLIENILKK